MTKIHFICRGNVYRSRMAEAYAIAKTRDNPDIQIDSSGVEAKLALNGEVDPVAIAHLKDDGIESYASKTWVQTTQELIDAADIVVVMSKSLLADSKSIVNIPNEKLVLIDIPDKDGVYDMVKQEVDNILQAI